MPSKPTPGPRPQVLGAVAKSMPYGARVQAAMSKLHATSDAKADVGSESPAPPILTSGKKAPALLAAHAGGKTRTANSTVKTRTRIKKKMVPGGNHDATLGGAAPTDEERSESPAEQRAEGQKGEVAEMRKIPMKKKPGTAKRVMTSAERMASDMHARAKGTMTPGMPKSKVGGF
jgi:hypothetical protein